MRRCYVVTITTPQKYLLDGLWFGEQKAKSGLIFIHGLSSSVFAQHKTLPVHGSTMSLYFNNRGHDELTGIRQINKQTEKGYERKPGGEAHEIFTDCEDDIQGAVDFLTEKGIKDIYLVGHSTGCQKSIYYLSRKGKQDLVKGVVLLCPLSDYAAVMKSDPEVLKKATVYARDLVKNGKSEELIPSHVWPEDLVDAQRFLSLYTPGSEEEIFTYSHEKDKPTTLQKVSIPTLVILAGRDEYGDRPMSEIAQWFKKESASTNLSTHIVDSIHNLTGKETEVSSLIDNWHKKL